MTQVTPPAPAVVVLRFTDGLTPLTYFRTAAIAYARGLLRAEHFRLLDFLQRQDLADDGRVIGMRHSDQTSGGMDLAHRYGLAHDVGPDRFWSDLVGLYRSGWAEQVVKPAPGRKAVYALCLRTDAIPHELPEDLARALKVWELPEPVDAHEDAAYGRLTCRRPAPVQRVVVPVREETFGAMASLPRWEHPAGSKAALVATRIRETGRALPEDRRPSDLRCFAVADPDRARAIEQRMQTLMGNGKTSPSYAKGFSPSGLLSPESTGLSWDKDMEKTKTTPPAAPTRKPLDPLSADLSSAAGRIRKRVWHSWRAQLGHSQVLLPQPAPEAASRSMTGSAWEDLHRTVAIALRRGGTESQLVELLTSNIVRHDAWGQVTDRAVDLGRLAGWRLWKFINERPDAVTYGYGRRRQVPEAAHVTAWDNPSDAELRERIAKAQAARAAIEARQAALAARTAHAEAERAELQSRWGLRRWAQQPEDVHLAEQAEQARTVGPRDPSEAERVHAAAVALARAEKRARRRRTGE